MELRKIIDYEINYCMLNNMSKRETKQHIFDFFGKYAIDYELFDDNDKYSFKIDNQGWELIFNSRGICRGFKGYNFE